jgi:5-hydroxyisourate hydrolase
MSLSTHVLDASRGMPAEGVAVSLERRSGEQWQPVVDGHTDADGRLGDLAAAAEGIHRLRFDTGGYFAARGVSTFYPEVTVCFQVVDASAHYHVPLLLSPYAYSTYRGS